MRLIDIATLLPLLANIQVLAQSPRFPVPKGMPRDLDAILMIEPAPSRQTSTIPSPSSTPTPFLKHLDLRQASAPEPTPFLRQLDLRQVAPVVAPDNAPAAAPVAPVNAPVNAPVAAPVAPANAPAPAPVAPVVPPAAAPVAPAAGAGGAGAIPPAQQPTPGAQANPVTTMMVDTVIKGVPTQVPKVYTQTFGAGASAPPVQSGEIGLGTLTGKIGVVKTHDAKSGAVAVGRDVAWGHLAVVLVAGLAALGGGVLGIARI